MMRILVNGAGGRMGGELRKLLEERGEALQAKLAGGADPQEQGGYPALARCGVEADVLLDFSFHTAVTELLPWAIRHRMPVVIATTGHSEEERAQILAAAKEIPVFYAANLSMGIALLAEFTRKAVAAFPEADVEIVETHHNRKMDAPSGTALMLANAASAARDGAPVQVGRGGWGKRVPGEITVHALRMGNIPGQHEVHITTDHQQLTLRHEAYDRVLFAEGAVCAASFLQGKPAGLYTMEELLHG